MYQTSFLIIPLYSSNAYTFHHKVDHWTNQCWSRILRNVERSLKVRVSVATRINVIDQWNTCYLWIARKITLRGKRTQIFVFIKKLNKKTKTLGEFFNVKIRIEVNSCAAIRERWKSNIISYLQKLFDQQSSLEFQKPRKKFSFPIFKLSRPLITKSVLSNLTWVEPGCSTPLTSLTAFLGGWRI